MAVKSKSYIAVNGRWWISAPELINVKILGVKRDGIGHDESATLPTGFDRKFYYSVSNGRIYFSQDQRFFYPITFFSRLQIFVIWQE